MKLLSNFFLLALLFTLLMLPLTVIDMATYNPLGEAEVLSTQTFSNSTLPIDSSALPPTQPPTQPVDYPVNDVEQSSPAVDVSQFDYYQMPSLYLGVPEGVQ